MPVGPRKDGENPASAPSAAPTTPSATGAISCAVASKLVHAQERELAIKTLVTSGQVAAKQVRA
jgi:hypothetical protein